LDVLSHEVDKRPLSQEQLDILEADTKDKSWHIFTYIEYIAVFMIIDFPPIILQSSARKTVSLQNRNFLPNIGIWCIFFFHPFWLFSLFLNVFLFNFQVSFGLSLNRAVGKA
jgi:hypothetical protein